MPVIEPASRYTELRRQEATSPKVLFAVDALCVPGSPVHDLAELTDVAVTAVTAGSGHVLDTSHVIFPNGAITLVLILVESHLSVRTWPEEKKAFVLTPKGYDPKKTYPLLAILHPYGWNP